MRFWPDFFAQIRQSQGLMEQARRLGEGDPRRNGLYVLTLDCFDRMPGLGFKSILRQNHISLSVDVKSLHPTDPGWDRRLTAPGER